MATANPFDLLGDFDNDDPSQLIAKVATLQPAKKSVAPTQDNAHPPSQAKLPSKPLPPTQAVREAKSDAAGGRGGGRAGSGGGRGYGRGRGGFNNRDNYYGNSRDSYRGNNENSGFVNGVSGGYAAPEDGDMGKPSLERGRGEPRGSSAPFRGGRRGGFGNGELSEGERPRRIFDRHSGTGRRESEEPVNGTEKNSSEDKLPGEEDGEAVTKENPPAEQEEKKEPEDKEMTLEEYEKVLEEKRKALQALRRTEERKVDLDKDFQSMMQLSSKKVNDDVFIKLGTERDLAKRKDIAEKEEKAKKSVSINEFLKPAEGETYSPGGRGRGRGNRGFRGGFGGSMNISAAPSIEDPGQFPTLGAK